MKNSTQTHLLDRLLQRVTRMPIWAHGLAALLTIMLVVLSNTVLDASYAASQFPVPFAQGQTTFDGELLKSYYRHMIDRGTLGVYWQTQFIDFGFIASVFLTGLILPSWLRRFARPATWASKVLSGSTVLICLGAIFDAIENLISFVMLMQPQTFPNWLVYPYSTMAVAKFACVTIGMVMLTFGLLLLIAQLLTRLWRKQGI
jgi:hypothetical protein